MYKSFKWLGPILWTFIGLACQKEMPELNTPGSEPVLPPLNHEGKNTFGCLIDDEPFVAKVDYVFAGPVAVWAGLDEETGWLRVQGTRELENDALEDVSFKTYITNTIGEYEMSISSDQFVGLFGVGEGASCTYYHDLNKKGTVEITFLMT